VRLGGAGAGSFLWAAFFDKNNQLELQGETRRPKARNTHFQGIQPVFLFLLFFKKRHHTALHNMHV
jgi:hypothetical protein